MTNYLRGLLTVPPPDELEPELEPELELGASLRPELDEED
jgi:hypothetical protein